MKKMIVRISMIVFMLIINMLSLRAYDFVVDGIYYDIESLETMTCIVVSNNSNHMTHWTTDLEPTDYQGDICIPAAVRFKGRELKVVGIGTGAFFKSAISSVYISEGIKVIGSHAFYGCDDLTDIIIPGTCHTIKNNAFTPSYNATGHRTIVLQSGADTLTVEGGGLGCRLDAIHSTLLNARVHVLSDDNDFSGFYVPFSSIIFDDAIESIPEKRCYNEREVDLMYIGQGAKSIGDLSYLDFADNSILFVNTAMPPTTINFSNRTFLNAKLVVPDASINLFKEAPIWQQFWEIVPASSMGADWPLSFKDYLPECLRDE